MKHNFLKKLTALLLGTIMVFSMIPAIAIGTKAADDTSVSLTITAATGALASDSKSISWTCNEFKWTTDKNNSSTAIRTSDSDHFRVYVGNKSTITANSGLISKVVITAISGYVPISQDVAVSGATTTTSGTTVTISLDTPATSVELPATSKQWRLSKVEVFFISGDLCDHNYVEESRENATCTEDGSVLYVCSECGDEKTETLKAGHVRENGVCIVCGDSTPTFTKVTPTLDDFSGTYLIVYEAGNLAFNGSLETLDAGMNGVEVVINENSITGDYSGYTFTIKKTDDGKYVIMSASGWYIGQTSYANGLKTSANPDYKHTISIGADGNAVITALSTSGDNTTLRYNASSGNTNLRFRYYKSGQQPIALYKLVEETHEPEETPSATVDTFGISLNKGVTVRVTLTINEEWFNATENPKVVFSNNVEFEIESFGTHTYTVDLTPAYIGSELTVTVGNMTEDVSVSAYIEKAKATYASNTELCALLDAIEAYGKAAKFNGEVEITETFEGVEAPKPEDQLGIFGEISADLRESVNLNIQINDVENMADLAYTITFCEKTISGKLASIVTDGVLTIENLRPANFNDEIVITINDAENETTSTLAFTVNEYLAVVYSDCTSGVQRTLVAATYQYGVATEAYMDAIAQ